MNIAEAIKKSRDFDCAAWVDAPDLERALDEIRAATEDGEEVGYIQCRDINGVDVLEAWGFDPDTTDASMTFRIFVHQSAH